MYQHFIKRCIDVFLSFVGIVLLSPLYLVLALFIKHSSEGPVLFKQTRIGKCNRTFKIIKFRTMIVDTPKDMPTHLLEKPDIFITKVGKFMRKTSLDELPQLWNILIGDMSIVGPRPSLPTQYDLIALRDGNGSSTIRPGLTGLAQISGRDELEITIKAAYDGQYAHNITFLNDVKIFYKTFASVLASDGIREGKSE